MDGGFSRLVESVVVGTNNRTYTCTHGTTPHAAKLNWRVSASGTTTAATASAFVFTFGVSVGAFFS